LDNQLDSRSWALAFSGCFARTTRIARSKKEIPPSSRKIPFFRYWPKVRTVWQAGDALLFYGRAVTDSHAPNGSRARCVASNWFDSLAPVSSRGRHARLATRPYSGSAVAHPQIGRAVQRPAPGDMVSLTVSSEADGGMDTAEIRHLRMSTGQYSAHECRLGVLHNLFACPLLVIAIAIAGLVFGEKAAQGEIIAELRELIGPDSARAVQTMILSAYKPMHSALASGFGVVTLLLGATGAFCEVYDALNNIWGVRRDTGGGAWALIRARFLSFGLVLIVGFLLLVSLVVSAALAGIAKYADRFLPIPAFVLHMVDVLFSVAVITVLFAMIFRMLPELKITWGDVWVGAALTAVLFTLGKFLIGFYIGKSVSASSYGAAGSLVIVVAWIYYSSLILYFGAEFTQVYACRYGSQIGLRGKEKPRLA
jgi:membrane protein